MLFLDTASPLPFISRYNRVLQDTFEAEGGKKDEQCFKMSATAIHFSFLFLSSFFLRARARKFPVFVLFCFHVLLFWLATVILFVKNWNDTLES